MICTMIQRTFLLLLLTQVSLCFPRNGYDNVGTQSRTHEDITSYGLRKAIGKFLKDNNFLEENTDVSRLDLIYHKFYKNDSNGLQKTSSAMIEILDNVLKQQSAVDAYIHSNAEQFLEAHNHIISLRNKLKELANDTDPNLTLIRKYIGQCLYTIQAFYSTSNWVEMKGDLTYRDFGVPGKSLMEVADQNLHTCSDCDNSGSNTMSCRNNIRKIGNKLTSGYHSSQKSPNPHRKTSSKIGKCGYGGISDKENGKNTAHGGINKDTLIPSLSPHHHLHLKAYESAREATYQFLVDEEIGIINELKAGLFARVFSLRNRKRGSWGFVIDKSGSMTDDILRVKEKCTDMVTDVRGTVYEPFDYVLTTFSDPVNLTTTYRTIDGLEMKNKIENITIEGGGIDCPEFSMNGLRAGIIASRDRSTLFTFTDATSKDENEREDVLALAKSKNITVNFVLTGNCTFSRRKRDLSRSKRETEISTYELIASETGGMVRLVSTDEIPQALDIIIEEQLPSATTVLEYFVMEASGLAERQFIIDKAVQNVKIKIVGASMASDFDIFNKSGSILLTDDVEILFEKHNEALISFVNPSPGVYTIKRILDNRLDVNITAQSEVDFIFDIMENSEDGFWKKITGSPIVGKTYGIQITVYNLQTNYSITNIILTDKDGNSTFHNATKIGSDVNEKFFTQMKMESKNYHVSIQGLDDKGVKFIRTAGSHIHPVNVRLTVFAPSELIVGTVITVPFTINNTGSEEGTYVVSVIGDNGFLKQPQKLMIPAGDTIISNFTMAGTNTAKTVTYDLKVIEFNSGETLQQQSESLYVNSQPPPSCVTYYTHGNCSSEFSDGTCSSVKWWGQTTLVFAATLTSVSGTNGLNLEYGDITFSPLTVNVSGDCCAPYGYITVIDESSNIQQCHFDVGRPVYLTESSSYTNKIAIGVIIGIALACISISIFLMVIVYKICVRPKLQRMKIYTFNIEATKGLPQLSEQSSKMRFYKNFRTLKPMLYFEDPDSLISSHI